MGYGFLADAIVAIHVVYVSFVVFGLLAILVGAALKWRWVRNPWFRVAHLAAIGFVALEAIGGMDCPLTVWEYQLRSAAGQEPGQGTFVGRLLHAVIFYDCPPWAFNVLHIGFAVLVLGTFFLIPPRWRRREAAA